MPGYGKLQIGNVTLDNNIILGPMAGVSDLPFRILCHEMGVGLVCMEMVSAKAIIYKNRNTDMLIEIHKDEHPVSLQLFGSEPAVMQEAVGMIENRPYDILDINMGCPVPKVVSNGEGSALMKKPELIEEIVAALVRVSDRPVTVKIRKGFNDNSINAVECALAAQEGGAEAVAVHGRTREQYYTGVADWDIIRKVKLAKQQLQRVLLGAVKRSGRCQERIVHMLQVLQGKQAQLPKLTALSLIDEVSRHKRLATEGAAVVSLQWEGAFRNQMSAGKPGTSEASLFAEDIGNEGDEMVGQALARRHVPSLDERCPVKVHAHHVVDALSNN